MRSVNNVLHNGSETLERHSRRAFERASSVVSNLNCVELDESMPGKILIGSSGTSQLPSSVLPYVLLWNDVVEYIAYPWARLLWNATNPLWLGLTIMYWAFVFCIWGEIVRGPLWLWLCALLWWAGWVLIFADLALRTEEFGTIWGALTSYVPGAVEWLTDSSTNVQNDGGGHQHHVKNDGGKLVHELVAERLKRADLSYHAKRLLLITNMDFTREEVQELLSGCNPRLVNLLTSRLDDIRGALARRILPPQTERASTLKQVRIRAQFFRRSLSAGSMKSVPTPLHPAHTTIKGDAASSSSSPRKDSPTASTSSTSCESPLFKVDSPPAPASFPSSSNQRAEASAPSSSTVLSSSVHHRLGGKQQGSAGTCVSLDAYGRPRLWSVMHSILVTRLQHMKLGDILWELVTRSDMWACIGLGVALMWKRSRKRAAQFLGMVFVTLLRRYRGRMLQR